jgi:hypothetical protein
MSAKGYNTYKIRTKIERIHKHTMKKITALLFATGTVFLAGCCGPHHASNQWEYKVAEPQIGPEGTSPVSIHRREEFLNELGRDGWVLVAADADLFYLKRPRH